MMNGSQGCQREFPLGICYQWSPVFCQNSGPSTCMGPMTRTSYPYEGEGRPFEVSAGGRPRALDL